jgi:hypothetical protein
LHWVPKAHFSSADINDHFTSFFSKSVAGKRFTLNEQKNGKKEAKKGENKKTKQKVRFVSRLQARKEKFQKFRCELASFDLEDRLESFLPVKATMQASHTAAHLHTSHTSHTPILPA